MDVDEKLICLVQKHICLYDVNSRYYSDKLSKQNAWEIISREIGISVAQCTQRWSRLRDNFRKGLKSREQSSGSGFSKRRPLKYEKELAFLKTYMQDRDQISNLDILVSPEILEITQNSDTSRNSLIQEESIEQHFDMQSSLSPSSNTNERVPQSISTRQSQVSITNQPTQTVSDVLKNYIESKAERDPVCLFFSAMAENVKKLPERLQLEVRQKVFNIVSDAELKWLNDRDYENLYSGYLNDPYSSSSHYQSSSYVPSSMPPSSSTSTTTTSYIPSSLPTTSTPTTPTSTTASSISATNTTTQTS